MLLRIKKRTEGFDLYKVVWRKDFADFGVEPIKPQFEAKYPIGLSDEFTIYGRDYEVVGNVFLMIRNCWRWSDERNNLYS